jgi:ABC-2 type transport system ATP-binding protein
MPILEINNLTKRYGKITAVNDLSFSVEKGNIYGILGPNGSGKTTTLGIVLGITQKDSGDFTWFGGLKGKHARQKIGALLETPNFYPYLSADKNLEIIAHIKHLNQTKFDDLLSLVDLIHRRNSPFYTYSLGMKQRLAIAGAMVGDPEVLIFDEPTNGLDPQGIAEVRDTIKKIAQQGKTILMASHILDEVEKICSHVAIIKNGVLLTTGTVGNIIGGDAQIEVSSSQNDKLKSILSNSEIVKELHFEEEKIVLSLNNDLGAEEVNKLAFQNGIPLNHLLTRKPSLESEFLEITKDN